MVFFSGIKKRSALLPLVFLCLFTGFASGQQNRTVTWSLALQNYRTGEMVSFGSPVQSWTGEQYRLVITPAAACYCYIIYESPDGTEAAVLYSGPLKQGDTWYSAVFELSQPSGSESLYIITSRDEQKTLAQRITAFASGSGAAQRRALMNEVFRIRSNSSRFREAPEKPVLMGGASRGSPEKNYGVEYSGSEVYVKTISLEH